MARGRRGKKPIFFLLPYEKPGPLLLLPTGPVRATNNITMGRNFGREKRKYSRKNTDGDMALKQRHRTLEMAINGTKLG